MILAANVAWFAGAILAGVYTHRRLAPVLADDDGTGSSHRLELVAIAATLAAALLLGLALAPTIEATPRPPLGHELTTYPRPQPPI